MDDPRRIPWTVPVLALIAAVRLYYERQIDWISGGVIALVAMRLASWLRATIDAREEREEEERKRPDRSDTGRS